MAEGVGEGDGEVREDRGWEVGVEEVVDVEVEDVV